MTTLAVKSSREYKIKKVGDYCFSPKDRLFLDTNVWLSVFGRQKSLSENKKFYSEIVDRIIKADSKIFLNAVVVSEFINACARKKFYLIAERIKKLQKEKKFKNSKTMKRVQQLKEFKNFRRHKCFQMIASDVRYMLKYGRFVNDELSESEVNRMMDN